MMLYRNGRLLGVCASVDNCRLFVGGIPKTKKREEILAEMRKVTDGVVDVIVYPSAADKSKNRGFAFVEYDSHRAAAMARRKLLPGDTHGRDRAHGNKCVWTVEQRGAAFWSIMKNSVMNNHSKITYK